jgi:hypothetical protein
LQGTGVGRTLQTTLVTGGGQSMGGEFGGRAALVAGAVPAPAASAPVKVDTATASETTDAETSRLNIAISFLELHRTAPQRSLHTSTGAVPGPLRRRAVSPTR